MLLESNTTFKLRNNIVVKPISSSLEDKLTWLVLFPLKLGLRYAREWHNS